MVTELSLPYFLLIARRMENSWIYNFSQSYLTNIHKENKSFLTYLNNSCKRIRSLPGEAASCQINGIQSHIVLYGSTNS